MDLYHLMNVDGTSEPPSSSLSTQTTATVHPKSIAVTAQQPGGGTATPAESAPAPRRKIGVGRREIRLCAEACVAKAATAATANTGSVIRRGSAEVRPKSEVQIIIETRRPAKSSTPEAGSVDDDADDESELSDVDEEVVAQGMTVRPLFPGLMKETDVLFSHPASEAEEEEEEEEDEDEDGEDVDEQMEEENEHGDDGEDQDITMGDEHVEGVAEDDESEGEEPTYHTPLSLMGGS